MTKHNLPGSRSSIHRRSGRKKDTAGARTRRRTVAGQRNADTPGDPDVADHQPGFLAETAQEVDTREIARSKETSRPRPTPSPRPRTDGPNTTPQASLRNVDHEAGAQAVVTSSRKSRWHPGRRILVTVLAMLVLAAATGTGYLAIRPGPPDVRPSVAKDGTYTPGSLPAEVGEAAVAAAVHQLPVVLSYDYRSLDQELKAASKHMTSGFAKTYQQTYHSAVMPVAAKKKAVTRALVRGAGMISISDNTVRCLVYVNQMLVSGNKGPGSGKNGKQTDRNPTPRQQHDATQISQNRVIVTMKQQDGNWLIDGLEPF